MLAVSGLISRGEGLRSGWKGDGLLGDGDLSSPGLGESLKLSNSPEGTKAGSRITHGTFKRKTSLAFPHLRLTEATAPPADPGMRLESDFRLHPGPWPTPTPPVP